jgi:hypothetical protein
MSESWGLIGSSNLILLWATARKRYQILNEVKYLQWDPSTDPQDFFIHPSIQNRVQPFANRYKIKMVSKNQAGRQTIFSEWSLTLCHQCEVGPLDHFRTFEYRTSPVLHPHFLQLAINFLKFDYQNDL